jgi:hypothetical protein
MSRACGTYGREEKRYRFFWGKVEERDHQEDIDICGMIISTCIVEKWIEVIWIKYFVEKWNEVIWTKCFEEK